MRITLSAPAWDAFASISNVVTNSDKAAPGQIQPAAFTSHEPNWASSRRPTPQITDALPAIVGT